MSEPAPEVGRCVRITGIITERKDGHCSVQIADGKTVDLADDEFTCLPFDDENEED